MKSRRQHRNRFPPTLACALVAVWIGSAWAQPQDANQRACINGLNKNLEKVFRVSASNVVGSRAPQGSGPGSIHRGSPEVTGAYSLHTSREVLGAHEAITPWNVSPSPSTRVRVIGPA